MEENKNNEPVLTENEARKFSPILNDFIGAYSQNRDKNVKEWLPKKIHEHLPEYLEKDVNEMADEIITTIQESDDLKKNLDDAKKNGMTREAWLEKKILESTAGMSDQEKSKYLAQINNSLAEQNELENTVVEDSQVSSNPKEIVAQIAKQAVYAGAKGAIETNGYELAEKIMDGEEIEPSKEVENALKTGADFALKAATGGALKVASEKGVFKEIPKGTPSSFFGHLAFSAVENAKVLVQVAQKKITPREAVNKMSDITSSVVAHGVYLVKKIGSAIGRSAGWMIGSRLGKKAAKIGAAIGQYTGGTIAHKAGKAVGKAVCSAAKVVAKGAVTVVKKVREVIESGVQKIKSKWKELKAKVKAVLA